MLMTSMPAREIITLLLGREATIALRDSASVRERCRPARSLRG
ncbi:hypothetical protein [Paraburkholderia sp. CNPSo 3272]|nr:hypothetical protein [Paraburkholderia sp. CNPSo 3272]